MSALSWAIMLFALAIQIISVCAVISGWRQGEMRSPILLVPVVLWYVALVVRGGPFFFESELIELSVVLAGHVLVTAFLAFFNYAGRRSES